MNHRIVTVLIATPILVLFLGSGVAHAVPSTLGPCAGDLTAGTFTLSGPCNSTAEIVVPNTITTVNGAGNTITAHDATPGSFIGGALTSTPGATMNVENLTIQGGGFTPSAPGNCDRGTLFGIHFNDASGSVTNVTIDAITEDTGCNPTTGIGIRADGVTAPRTVTITNTHVTNYQRNGIDARGFMTMNITGSTVHPKNLSGVIAQNGVVYAERFEGQPSGTVSNSTIFGIGDFPHEPTPETATQPAILVAGATNVTITNNALKSDPNHAFGPDGGVIVLGGDQTINGSGTPSTGIVISHNDITRAHPNGDDPNGFGVWVVPNQQATLICNTFSGWKTNIVGAEQPPCETATTTTTTPIAVAGSTVPGTTAAPVVTSTGELPRTGGSTTMPILGIALLAAGTMLSGMARRRHNRRT